MTNPHGRKIKNKAKKNKEKKKKRSAAAAAKASPSGCWVDRLKFVPVDGGGGGGNSGRGGAASSAAASSSSAMAAAAATSSESESGEFGRSERLTLVSWNVLAEAYCSRRSHRDLPRTYQRVAFRPEKRRDLLLRVLGKLLDCGVEGGDGVDVLCLQEVDMKCVASELERRWGYAGVETPRNARDSSNSSPAGKADSCGVYVRTDRWEIVESELIRLDDLATLSSSAAAASATEAATIATSGSTRSSTSNANICDEKQRQQRGVPDVNGGAGGGPGGSATGGTNSPDGAAAVLQGLQQSFLRRNVALLVRIRSRATGRTAVVANAHLFWHPGYEYVKLCQTHYILLRAREFRNGGGGEEPFVFCGDLNSRPHGAAHWYLSRGSINAKRVAPWYNPRHPDDDSDGEGGVDDSDSENGETIIDGSGIGNDGCEVTTGDTNDDEEDEQLATNLAKLDLVPPPSAGAVDAANSSHNGEGRSKTEDRAAPSPKMRYLLDATLNKFCRWLRILGQDTALETEEEEKIRTGEGKMILFERCLKERRTLVTTSTRLMVRTDCPPGAYCINPSLLPNLEVALVHMLLTHGVVLEPSTFLSTCVVCNGKIVEVYGDDEKLRILDGYQAPLDLLSGGMEVFECNGCRQGYWWCDRPTSSASRVKNTATKLFELCLKAGVPYRGPLKMFDHIDVEELRRAGWDTSQRGSELLAQKLDVIDWLRNEALCCPFNLKSVYAAEGGAELPFTNVTSSFVDTLDYIFTENLSVAARLHVPTTFSELNLDGIQNGHLVPSDVWPSDHLAIGACLCFDKACSPSTDEEKNAQQITSAHLVDVPPLYCAPLNSDEQVPRALSTLTPNHGARCTCGCIPSIPSLFEMAELRKKAMLKRQVEQQKS